ncbi:calcium-dependent protein kinase 4-like [Dendronephthya gigantea]|uniref:calcium-dependent protein kinase 4-like n=1 Tax=Dendronephthya gigantea TaxID=151771 RepID=UPI00106B712F|nr:calcium-dependent protein kinase 4-like [Dendronephthya gigantea]
MDEKMQNKKFTEIKTALETEHGFNCTGSNWFGAGAFGHVVRVKCINSDESYAIKILPMTADDEDGKQVKYQERELEALITTSLEMSEEAKRNIIQYYKSWIMKVDSVDQLCIQMELCSVNLWDFIYRNKIGGPKIIQQNGPPRFYQQVFRQVLSGLSFIHTMRWIHRDIHPGNILTVNPNPEQINDLQIKIADFGLARHVGIELDKTAGLTIIAKLPKVSFFSKSGCFRAPELNTDSYDFKVDVYSAGLVLYFISCYLENEDSWFTELEKLKEGKLQVDEGLFHKDDEILSGLIKNLIQKDPNARLAASTAKEYMFPETKRATTTSWPLEIGFLARKQDENDLSQCILKELTFSGMQEAIADRTHVPERRQVLRQKRMINGETKLIKIENDNDVENIINVAKKQKQEVVVVVTEIEDVEMTEISPASTSAMSINNSID